LVDPLDGTKEFIKKTGEFTVNIAYIDNGTPTHGIVYAPAIQRLFRTDHTGKSFESIKSLTKTEQYGDKSLLVSTPDRDALTVIASKSHNNAETDTYMSQYNVSKIINVGSSLKFCLIANGEADFYPRLGRTMEWDTAAGHAILLGAGGYVTNLSTQKALNYGKPGFENPFFIAHNSTQIIKN
jgi:3'(2'), 5'-bisphosphate nucleotidase